MPLTVPQRHARSSQRAEAFTVTRRQAASSGVRSTSVSFEMLQLHATLQRDGKSSSTVHHFTETRSLITRSSSERRASADCCTCGLRHARSCLAPMGHQVAPLHQLGDGVGQRPHTEPFILFTPCCTRCLRVYFPPVQDISDPNVLTQKLR